MANELFDTPQAKADAMRDAEALSRKAESEAAVLRGRAEIDTRLPAAAARDAEKRLAEAATALASAEAKGAVVDKSGTAPTLSDSAGNYAPNPDVANTGGIGVEASNSTPSGAQAKTPEAVDLSPAASGITDGDQPIGEAATPLEATETAKRGRKV